MNGGILTAGFDHYTNAMQCTCISLVDGPDVLLNMTHSNQVLKPHNFGILFSMQIWNISLKLIML